MNDQHLYEKFEICLNALQLGASVENCLNLFPDDANELLPLLRTVQHAQQAAYDAPRVDVITRSRTKLLREADRLRNKKTANVFGMRIPRVALATTFVLLLLVFGAGGLLATSAKSLPGDQTYPLKLVVENLRVQFAPDPGMRIDLEENINQRRVTEVQHLLDIGRSVPVSFTGKVERMTDGFWIVKDILVNVDETTKISGEISPGDVIEIDGTTSSDGWVNAVDVRLDAGEVDGIISSISETGFSIDGIPFVIDHETQFDPRIIEGDRVIVLIKTNQDDAIIARAVLKISE